MQSPEKEGLLITVRKETRKAKRTRGKPKRMWAESKKKDMVIEILSEKRVFLIELGGEGKKKYNVPR